MTHLSLLDRDQGVFGNIGRCDDRPPVSSLSHEIERFTPPGLFTGVVSSNPGKG